jgi:hypothetical protein
LISNIRALSPNRIIGIYPKRPSGDVIAPDAKACQCRAHAVDVMKRKVAAVLVLATTAAAVLASHADARQARRRDLQRQVETELDTSGMSLEALRNLYIGTWRDQGGRFWFSIAKITGARVQSATFRMAHLKNGQISGNQLSLNSMSCVPLIGCYSYAIKGKLLTNSRMDMRATDETGDTVHFVLVRK